jgi:hypothetical protein
MNQNWIIFGFDTSLALALKEPGKVAFLERNKGLG